MKTIILLGAPGAGKGTAAEKIRARTAFEHVSTGDMLRAAVKEGNEIGAKVEGYMKCGQLVPDDIMIRLVEDRISDGGPGAAYMFDGFPRTDNQATLLDATLLKLDGTLELVFSLDAPREVLIARLTGRRICRQCGANYHMVNIPPKEDGICDACGGELHQRADDQKETMANRLQVFDSQTEGLIVRYERYGILVKINSDRSVDAMVDKIVAML